MDANATWTGTRNRFETAMPTSSGTARIDEEYA